MEGGHRGRGRRGRGLKLEAVLKRQFDQHGIDEDYTYGIYDCFTDSVVYGKFVARDENFLGCFVVYEEHVAVTRQTRSETVSGLAVRGTEERAGQEAQELGGGRV